MKKSLFNDDKAESYTEVANTIDLEIGQALAPIFRKYKDTVSIRDLQLLAISTITELALTNLLEWNKSDEN